MEIKATPSFIRRSRKLFKYQPSLKTTFHEVIEKLMIDPFAPSLKAHKLSGDLKDFWSCSITYQIRLRYKIVNQTIELIDIGNHDEVY